MWRTVGSIVAGLVAWLVIVTLLNFCLRAGIPGYHAAEPVLAFTLPMMIARLLMVAVTSVATGYLVRLIAPASKYAPWIVGLILLAFFLPTHVQIWSKLPIWYHLTFLITLAPLVAAGAQLYPRERVPAV